MVWARDGLVYTCVSDAPVDVIDDVVARLRPGRFAERRRPVVDFVLGPFGLGLKPPNRLGAVRLRTWEKGVVLDPAAAEDAAALALGGAAPDPVVDPVGERVLEASGP